MSEPHMPEHQQEPDDYWEPTRKKSYLTDTEDVDIRREDKEEQEREYWTSRDNFGEDCSPK